MSESNDYLQDQVPYRFARYRSEAESPDTNCAVSSSDLRKTYYLTVLAEVQGINTRILIDTGSALTAINQELWNKISTTSGVQIQKSVFTDVRTASGEIVTVLGASNMNFNIGNSTYTFKTHVVPKLNYAAIIGKDFLQQNDCVIDFKSGYLKISRDNIVPFHAFTNGSNADTTIYDFEDALPFFNTVPEADRGILIHAADTFEIPANSECAIPATFRENGLTDTTGIIEPNERLPARFNICGASALVTVSAAGLVPFRVINPNSKPVKIFRFTNLGRFLPSKDNIVNISFLSDQGANDSVPQTTPHQYCETSETEIDYDISPYLTSEQAQHLEQFLNHNADVFSQGPHDLGRTSIVQHAITTDGS